MKSLADWSPEFLRTLYALEVEKLKRWELTPEQKEVFSWKVDALYRLGAYEDMKELWDKLLAKDALLKHPIRLEQALIGGIRKLIWLNSYGIKPITPAEKNEQLGEISKKIRELQRLINKAGEANFEEKVILETILHKRNVEYRNQNGEKIDSQPSLFLKFIDNNANTELQNLPLDEHLPWKSRNQTQRLGWWTREALALTLNDILDFYSERMGDYSKVYKEHYGQFQPKLIKGLRALMKDLYGSPLEEYVGRIASVIMDKDISKDYVRGYKD
jgi:hypothetical protein